MFFPSLVFSHTQNEFKDLPVCLISQGRHASIFLMHFYLLDNV